ncbi:MSD4-like protein [Mya arenaria]|uniref:MSD4-like protein n=1 Tax=Mya arenaria TaxID=6604 RepID=A0ABY7DVL5_MYAAR|nr:myb/SANT-like DNA-binding domain-containing protein 4 [Mya arenaria]WAR01732.1 MSD4-like protein [Mya arenaria]
MEFTSKKTKRNPNFTRAEIDVLLKQIEIYKDVIYNNKQNTTAIHSRKRHVWELITKEVNTVNMYGLEREHEEVRKKWTCLASDTRKKFATYKRAIGHGAMFAPEMSSMDFRVAKIVDTVNKQEDDLDSTDMKFLEMVNDTSNEGPVEEEDQDSKLNILAESSNTSTPSCSNEETFLINRPVSPSSDNNAQAAELEPALKRRRHNSDNERSQKRFSGSIEEQRLAVEKCRLGVEERRLMIEEERLAIERERMDIERQQLQIARHKYGGLKLM